MRPFKLLSRLIAVFGVVMMFAVTVWSSGNGLSATYYNNTFWSAPIAVAKTDTTIDVDWGFGGPTGVNSDNFSALWTGSIYIPETAGYTFSLAHDDYMKLTIDGASLYESESWTGGASEFRDTSTVTLTKGFHTIEIKFKEYTGGAYIRLMWRNDASLPQAIIPQTYLYTTMVPISVSNATILTGDGLLGQYYNKANSADCKNYPISGTVNLSRTDSIINFDWGTGNPADPINNDYFQAKWTGYVNIPTTGDWTFYTSVDDGVKLYIDGALLIDKWIVQPETKYNNTVKLSAGFHTIQMDYYENTGFTAARLYWSGPGISTQTIIPQMYLYTGNGLVGHIQEYKAPITHQVAPQVLPDIEIVTSKSSGKAPLAVDFSYINKSLDIKIKKVKWLFGDGTFSDKLQVRHIYSKPESYQTKLLYMLTNNFTGFVEGPEIVVSESFHSHKHETKEEFEEFKK